MPGLVERIASTVDGRRHLRKTSKMQYSGRMRWLAALSTVMLACGAPVVPVAPPVQSLFDAGTALGLDAGSMTSTDAGRVADAGLAPDAGFALDAGLAVDAGVPRAPCTLAGSRLSCQHRTFEVDVSRPLPQRRVVHVGLPVGTPPPRGWPTVILFQGSLFSAQLTWSASRELPLGAFWQTSTVQSLLEAGFAVMTPEVQFFGTTYWDTNTPQWSLLWTSSPDHHFMLALFDGLAAGTFGSLDGTRLYAGGISSGGYMTSRMALSYPGKFKALAIHSASWATCAGLLCVLPGSLPADHPPTLFLHGELDLVVPLSTMRPYEERLRTAGVRTRIVVEPTAAHEWLQAGATELRDFFVAN